MARWAHCPPLAGLARDGQLRLWHSRKGIPVPGSLVPKRCSKSRYSLPPPSQAPGTYSHRAERLRAHPVGKELAPRAPRCNGWQSQDPAGQVLGGALSRRNKVTQES